jgi:hypothetical protein
MFQRWKEVPSFGKQPIDEVGELSYERGIRCWEMHGNVGEIEFL